MSNQTNFEVKITAGTNIKKACQKLTQQTIPSLINFNGVQIYFDPQNPKTVDELVKFYHDSLPKETEEEKAKKTIALQKVQEKLDLTMLDLESLDFDNLGKVLDWVCELQTSSDYVGTFYDKATVIQTFEDHRIIPNMNCFSNFNSESAENFAHYICGQALSGVISVGSPHPMVHKFVSDWKLKFA